MHKIDPEADDPVRRHRGRPLRLPDDVGPVNGLLTAVSPRVAWLLVTLRLASLRPGNHDRRQFARGLVRLGVNADPTRISRWESGAVKVPARVLFGYEQLLGLRPGTLSSIADELGRFTGDGAEALMVRGVPETPAEIEALVSRFADPAFTGTDWLTLAEVVRANDRMFLPESMWIDLTQVLVGTANRATGTARVTRDAAIRALVRDPRAQRCVFRALGALVTTPGAQGVHEMVPHLADVPGSGVADLVMRLLGEEPGPMRHGAARAAASKVALGHLDGAQLERLENTLADLLGQTSGTGFDLDIADVLASMPEFRRDAVLARAASVPETVRSAIAAGTVIPPERSRQVARLVCRDLDHPPALALTGERDLMLLRLVEEALFHVHGERRYQAAVLLEASPYRAGLVSCLLNVLLDQDSATATRMLVLLRALRPEADHVAPLLNLSHAHPSATVRAAAARALARAPETLRALDHEQLLYSALRDATAVVRIAATNALGEVGSRLLGAVVDDGDKATRLAAAWWLDVGPAVVDRYPAETLPEQYTPEVDHP